LAEIHDYPERILKMDLNSVSTWFNSVTSSEVTRSKVKRYFEVESLNFTKKRAWKQTRIVQFLKYKKMMLVLEMTKR